MTSNQTGSMPSSVELSHMLRGADLRVTGPRVAVLRAVHGHPHADTESIIGVARDDLGWVSHQAVYDVLRALTDAGLVRRIQPAGGVARYEARVGDNHHHVVCRSCGAIADVDCAVGSAPCLTPADDWGYQIDEAEITYWGRCPDCRSSHVPTSETVNGKTSNGKTSNSKSSNSKTSNSKTSDSKTSNGGTSNSEKKEKRGRV